MGGFLHNCTGKSCALTSALVKFVQLCRHFPNLRQDLDAAAKRDESSLVLALNNLLKALDSHNAQSVALCPRRVLDALAEQGVSLDMSDTDECWNALKDRLAVEGISIKELSFLQEGQEERSDMFVMGNTGQQPPREQAAA